MEIRLCKWTFSMAVLISADSNAAMLDYIDDLEVLISSEELAAQH